LSCEAGAGAQRRIFDAKEPDFAGPPAFGNRCAEAIVICSFPTQREAAPAATTKDVFLDANPRGMTVSPPT
jgi:hypothetical protein